MTVIWEQIWRANLLEIPQPSLTKISLKITPLKFIEISPSTNELNSYVM